MAFADDEETVVSSAKSLKTAIKQAERQGHALPLMFKVPQQMLPYVGAWR